MKHIIIRLVQISFELHVPRLPIEVTLHPPPGQFFMGAKLFIGTPWMGNEGVLKKKIGLGYVKLHGFYADP